MNDNWRIMEVIDNIDADARQLMAEPKTDANLDGMLFGLASTMDNIRIAWYSHDDADEILAKISSDPYLIYRHPSHVPKPKAD